MRTQKELVTIIVPVYNSANTITRCLDSLLTQEYNKLEIVIVDDGSKDESLKLIKMYHDDRIRIIKQKHSGVSNARNLGLENSTGDYVLFVDSDDTIEKNAISVLVNAINDNSVDVVKYGYNRIENGIVVAKNLQRLSGKVLHTKNDDEYNLMLRSFYKDNKTIPCYSVTLFMRREFIEKNSIRFDPSRYMMEDAIYHFDILSKDAIIYFLDIPLYNVYINDNSVTRSRENMLRVISGAIDSSSELLSRLAYDGDSSYNYFRLIADYILKYIKEYKKTDDVFYSRDAMKIYSAANMENKKIFWKMTKKALMKKSTRSLRVLSIIYYFKEKVAKA